MGCGQNETVVDNTPSTREDRKLGAILVGTNWNRYKSIYKLDQFIPSYCFCNGINKPGNKGLRP